ncbi:LLM class flavin-dependent oxidoreductase [Haladaptatus sp. QDMS2]|uniref:LLM class flavin-dependent oxidoreductase n=1 Tax=Haladaptatus sp. QDMS2 TaxID=3033391 RepID=UPI0023E7B030|nr:LLM class flavin-dependent oxidoreductase [Haladaptatus sp. QDMS2]
MTLEIHYNVYGCFRPPNEDIELAKAAVDAGFEGIWIGDHFQPWLDSRPYTHHILPWFGTLMSEIPDVPVGTSVTCPTMRYRPPVLAQALATLDNMFPDRLELGVGTGEALNEAAFVDGEWPEWGTRVGMLIETIQLMRRLWTEDDYITHEGKYYEYEDIKIHTPPRSDIDIHWAAWGPQSSRAAGKYADHLITAASASLIEDQILPNLSAGLAETGRSLKDVDVTTEVSVNYGDPVKLVREIRERGEYIPDHAELSNPDPRSVQAVANRELSDMSDREIRELNTITDDTVEIIEKLEEFSNAGVTRVLVGSNCGDPYETIDVFESDVIPHFE